MPQTATASSSRRQPWLRAGALALTVVILGLPINDLWRYGLLVLATLAIFSGHVSARPRAWYSALAVAALAVAVEFLFPAPRIDEGHNVFLVGAEGSALEKGLPADAFRQMQAEFDAAYPLDRRCNPDRPGCWRRARSFPREVKGCARSGGGPDGPYAFSADGIFDRGTLSRRVTGIDFSDPVWLRLGFVNDARYDWCEGDISRTKPRPWWNLFHRWQVTIPYFVAYRFPSAFAGGRLCWTGRVLWEEDGGRFAALVHDALSCRAIGVEDIGRTVFGVSIGAPLSMRLEPPLAARLRLALERGAEAVGVAGALLLLLRGQRAVLAPALVLVGLSLIVVVLHDASFVGGVRPLDGGDDGVFYEAVGRWITEHILAGDFRTALEGAESTFFFGAPGLRYFRSLEHFIFGDTFLGYLSLVLVQPFVIFLIYSRFFQRMTAFWLTVIFVIVPVGAIFGTTYFQYVKWASRGFADPGAAIVFLAATAMLIGRSPDLRTSGYSRILAGGLLFAVAVWLRSNISPAVAIILLALGGRAILARDLRRFAVLCCGFLPVVGMALHNWYFGNTFTLFSANASYGPVWQTQPGTYLAAFTDLVRFDFASSNVARVFNQLLEWLAGPSEMRVMAPLHAAAVAVVLRVASSGRLFDSRIRLLACAALPLLVLGMFIRGFGRYHNLTWFLVGLVCAVWIRDEGLSLAERWFPQLAHRLRHNPATKRFATTLAQWSASLGLTGRPVF